MHKNEKNALPTTDSTGCQFSVAVTRWTRSM